MVPWRMRESRNACVGSSAWAQEYTYILVHWRSRKLTVCLCVCARAQVYGWMEQIGVRAGGGM
jgi:hypothetical protein